MCGYDGDADWVGVSEVEVKSSLHVISLDGANKQGHLTPRLTGKNAEHFCPRWIAI